MGNDLRWTPERLAAHEAEMKKSPKGRFLSRDPGKSYVLANDHPGPLTEGKPHDNFGAGHLKVEFAALDDLSTSKYKNVKTGGYASKKEARRASDLKLMQEGGVIRNLREQVEFEIVPKQDGERAANYRADFVYDEFRDGDWREVVEDAKGVRTSEYVLKRKLMLHVHGIKIRET